MYEGVDNDRRWEIAARISARYEVSMTVARAWVESCPDEQRVVSICDHVLQEHHELTSRAFYHRLRLTTENARSV